MLTGFRVRSHICNHSKLQASLRAHDLVQIHELVDVAGHRFGKLSVLATMPGEFYSRKLERTSNADRLKFNGRLVQIYINLIGPSIVAFVSSLLGNVCETRKLHKTFKHTRHNVRKLVGIRVTTHPFHRAVQRSTPIIGICFERCSMLAW